VIHNNKEKGMAPQEALTSLNRINSKKCAGKTPTFYTGGKAVKKAKIWLNRPEAREPEKIREPKTFGSFPPAKNWLNAIVAATPANMNRLIVLKMVGRLINPSGVTQSKSAASATRFVIPNAASGISRIIQLKTNQTLL
jgi:hypothetical protein